MKTIIIGDIHGLDIWKKIVNTESFDRVVFIGDYFDSFQINTEKQINNFLDIIEYKKSSGKEVILLVGNHDHHYFVGNTGTSGFQELGYFQINPVLQANKDLLQMAYQFDNILCTHAGVSETFMDQVFGKEGWKIEDIPENLNELWQYKPLAFVFNGNNIYGDDIEQTPIWIRPGALRSASQNIKKAGIIQIVGHTQQTCIDIKEKATGGKYFFIDTLATSKEYLIIENNKIESKKVII